MPGEPFFFRTWIERYQIRVLDDDRGFFPSYAAVLLHAVDQARRQQVQGQYTPQVLTH